MSEAPSPTPVPPRNPAAAGTTRLRAVTRRVPRRPSAAAAGDDAQDYPDEAPPEPNIRLSRALGVMLLLHLVAIGGVVAFGQIKEIPSRTAADGSRNDKRNRSDHRTEATKPVDPPDNAPTPFPAAPASVAATPAGSNAPRSLPTPALSRVESDAVRLIESGGPNPVTGGERAYVVNRGETVQTIAQKLRVEPAALLRLNNIDDPRKIQTGQRLRVPPAPPGRSRS